MAWQEILGFVSGAVMTFSTFPQVWRLFKLKSAREISLPFNIFFIMGTICWLSYGVSLNLMPVILWNAVTLLAGIAMLYAKLKFG